MKELSVSESIHEKIYTIRNTQIMLDIDLAKLYGVEVKRLNEQVKRNIERFPKKFRIQLTNEEIKVLRSQFATLEKAERGQHSKYSPYGFTEQGVAMLSSVLHSNTAIEISIKIINAFVEMRHFIHHNAQIFTRLENVEFKQDKKDFYKKKSKQTLGDVTSHKARGLLSQSRDSVTNLHKLTIVVNYFFCI